MGESPEARAQRAAREAADQAYARQQELISDIGKKAETYETKAKDLIPALSSLAGKTPTEYVTGTRKGFEDYVGQLQGKYEPLLTQFDPNVLGSPSSKRLNESLLESAGLFTQGVSDVGRRTSADLYRTLAAGPEIARSLASSSATNLALDPTIMGLATNPPIKTELDPGKLGYSQYMKYNV
jgi:hypothetical protein